MRTFLNRIGLIGEEFKSCREHLYQHLDGNAAWRYGEINGRSRRLVERELEFSETEESENENAENTENA